MNSPALRPYTVPIYACLLALYGALALVQPWLPLFAGSSAFSTTAGWFALAGASALFLPQYGLKSADLLRIPFYVLAFASVADLLREQPGGFERSLGMAVCLMFWSVSVLLLRNQVGKAARRAMQLLAYLLIVGSVLGMVGNFLELSLIYDQPLLKPVPIPLAATFMALGVILLFRLRVITKLGDATGDREARQISAIGIGGLIVLAFITGLTSFIALQNQVENALYQHLNLTMANRSIVFQNAIDSASLDVAPLTRSHDVSRALKKLLENPHNPAAAQELMKFGTDALPYTLRALRFEDTDGHVLVRQGAAHVAQTLWVNYLDKSEIRLNWYQQLPYLELRLRIEDSDGSALGNAVLELPAPALEQLVSDTYDLGHTGEMMVCGYNNSVVRCMQSRHRDRLLLPPADSDFGRIVQDAIDGELSEANHPTMATDIDGRTVLMTYGPIGRVGMAMHIAGNGLAMIVKMDADEFFLPVRTQLHRVLPTLIVIIIVGGVLLRRFIKPLVHALRDNEARFRELTELSSDWYWAMTATLRFSEITGQSLASYGIFPEEWLGHSLFETTATVENNILLQQLNEALARQEPFYDVTLRIPMRGASALPHSTYVSLSGAPQYDDEGRFLGYRGVGKDITRRKLAEEGLINAQQDLERRVEERTAELSTSNRALAVEVQERRQAEERLKRSEARFRSLTELSSDWYWEQDAEYRFTQISGEVDRKGGFSARMSVGKELWLLDWASDAENDWTTFREQLDLRRPFHDFTFKTRDFQDNVRYASISGQPIFDDEGRFIGYRGIGKDVTEKRLSEERIHFLAHYDALTRLPNRVLLAEQVRFALDRARRGSYQVALLFIDLDRFKVINDSLGHDAGDQVLRVVSQRLTDCVRETDMVARLGGDEFVVLLDTVQDSNHIRYTARRILDAINQSIRLSGDLYHVGASIGIAVFPEDGGNLAELLKNSDAAMYRAKEEGRNGIFFYSETINQQSLASFRLESDLRYALEHGQLVLYYQPKLDLISKRITGVEALLRWRHPTHGLLSPNQFIHLAEECGLIVPVGDWVLENACRELVAWDEAGLPRMVMAVNLSPRQLQDTLPDKLLELLRRHKLAPERLELELTESLMLKRPERDIALLEAIKSHGIRIALDDFGTGFSSLSSLASLPIDVVKMHSAFIERLPEDVSSAAITRSIITMAKGIHLEVVAEGVETTAQYDWLAKEGCQIIQGFHFCHPLPASSLVDFVNEHLRNNPLV